MAYYEPGLSRESGNYLRSSDGSAGFEQRDEVQEYIEYEEEREELRLARTGEARTSAGTVCRKRRDRVMSLGRMLRPTVSEGGPGEIVVKLDNEGQGKLLETVMETKGMNNIVAMRKMRDRLTTLGMEFPMVDVSFKDVYASAEVFTGGRSVPTLTNAALSMLEFFVKPITMFFQKSKDKKTLIMLDHLNGVIKPGRLTLLLGPPGAGKSTLLRLLAGQMKDKDVQLKGDVRYNGKLGKEFVVERAAVYIDQEDSHIAEMTVRETMAFSARCMGQGVHQDHFYTVVKAKEKELGVTPDPMLDEMLNHIQYGVEGDHIMVMIISQILGLDVCIDTVIGNALLKGISGGQKKRVTTGEMAVGRCPVVMMDEISTGLDSASTFLITQAMCNLCHYMKSTIMIALLQPTPDTYEIFDDIMVMGDGKILFHGPKEEVEPFFESLGLVRPPRKAVADFLQEITSKTDQKLYYKHQNKDNKFLSCQDISDAFYASKEGKARLAELAAGTQATEADNTRLRQDKYALSSMQMLSAVGRREFLLTRRALPFLIIRAVQTSIVAMAVGTMWVNEPKDNIMNANMYMSACFFSTFFMLIGGFAEVPIFVARLPVFFKQRNYKFFSAWVYCVAGAANRVPDNLLMVTLWTVIVYWTVGFTAEPGQFFIFWLVLVCVYTFSTTIFRTIGAITRNDVIAQAVAASMLVLCINTCGYTLDRGSIPPWWIWMYWINPLAYAIRALLVNEMNTDDWSTSVVYEGQPTAIGIIALDLRSFQTETWWVWVAVGVLLGASFVLLLVQAYCLTCLDALKGSGAAQQEEEEEEEDSSAGSAEHTKKTSLGFTPFHLAFRDIKYHVPKPGHLSKELTLLKGISGVFAPGRLTALMGASGAGKTTLMDVLAGRKTGGREEGTVTLNGYPKVQKTFARVMGYVEQFDIHCSQATVHEALMFSGKMRLPEDTDDAVKSKFIDEVMELVELGSLANAIIGVPGVSGLSVEQRKRLTIAVELVANPSVVFMDEPTSGLDARAASIVMRAVRNTVNTGRTVVCTIHQPSLEIFQAFDELLLLKRGGETIFFGDMGVDQVYLIEHFESVPGVENFKVGNNPANWMLDVSAADAEIELGADFADFYKKSPLKEKVEKRLDTASQPVEGTGDLHFDTAFSVSSLTQLRLLLQRNMTTYWRSPNYNFVRMMITIFTGLVFGSLYWDKGTVRTEMTDVLNIMGCLYGSTTFIAIANAIIVLPVVHNERVVFYREKASGMYSPAPFATAQGIVEIPYIMVQAVVYVLIVYWMAGFEATATKFFWFLLYNWLNLTCITYFGIMAINLTPAVEFGTVFVAFFFTLWNLTCGFVSPQPNIPGWWIWLYWGNPISYVLYGLTASQLGDVNDEFINVGGIGEPEELMSVAAFVENQYGYKHSFIGWVVLIQFAFIATFRSVSIIALLRLNFQKR